MIPGLGRSAGEVIGYPLQCSWDSLVVQLVKNPPAMQETILAFINSGFQSVCPLMDDGEGKDPDAGKDRRREEKGTTEDEMVG